jgi:hypothetical protein
MQGSGQRPGLRPVHGDLDEPQRTSVVADPTFLVPGVDVDPGDPVLIGLAAHRRYGRDSVQGGSE